MALTTQIEHARSNVILGQLGIPHQLAKQSPLQVPIPVNRHRQNHWAAWPGVDVVRPVNSLQHPAVLLESPAQTLA